MARLCTRALPLCSDVVGAVRLGCARRPPSSSVPYCSYVPPSSIIFSSCARVGKQSAGGTGVGVEMEAHWIRSEEDGNHSESSQRESAGFFHPRSERRLGFVWKKRRLRFTKSLFINSIATSLKCLAGKVIKTCRNYN
jgi:hypothetical protein